MVVLVPVEVLVLVPLVVFVPVEVFVLVPFVEELDPPVVVLVLVPFVVYELLVVLALAGTSELKLNQGQIGGLQLQEMNAVPLAAENCEQ